MAKEIEKKKKKNRSLIMAEKYNCPRTISKKIPSSGRFARKFYQMPKNSLISSEIWSL